MKFLFIVINISFVVVTLKGRDIKFPTDAIKTLSKLLVKKFKLGFLKHLQNFPFTCQRTNSE